MKALLCKLFGHNFDWGTVLREHFYLNAMQAHEEKYQVECLRCKYWFDLF